MSYCLRLTLLSVDPQAVWQSSRVHLFITYSFIKHLLSCFSGTILGCMENTKMNKAKLILKNE